MALGTSSGITIQNPSDGATAPIPSNTNHLTWTPAHEARLAHVQTQLSAAQAKWSEEQDLWLDEVQGLEELRRAHKKAEKKAAKRLAKKAGAMGKTKASVSPGSAVDSEEEGDDGDEVTKTRGLGQEILNSSFGLAMRRMSVPGTRRSTFPEGGSSNASRRASMIERVQSASLGGILRRLSTKGGKDSESPPDS